MKLGSVLLTAALACGIAATAIGQGADQNGVHKGVQGGGQQPADPQRTAGLWGSQDPRRGAFLIANCKNPPAAGAALPARMPFSAGTAPGPSFQEVSSTGIPGVIAAGLHWQPVWQDVGMADGIVAFDDGSLWIAAMDASEVVRVDKEGKPSVIYRDTYTGAALAANSKGEVFVAERALGNAVWMIKPQRKLVANKVHGESFDCVSNFINDILADNKGGIYMTMDGLYYINPKHTVMGPFGSIPGNGLMLSPDEKTFYATGKLPAAGATAGDKGNPRGLVAYDVQPDGSLTHERQIADTCGDGLVVDELGRIYCTGARVPDPADASKMISGIGVFSPAGKMLGIIPQPRGFVTLAFGGPDKKTLYAEVNHIHDGKADAEQYQIMSIQLIAAGNNKRPK